jgi:uncharacterized Zn finger protein
MTCPICSSDDVHEVQEEGKYLYKQCANCGEKFDHGILDPDIRDPEGLTREEEPCPPAVLL